MTNYNPGVYRTRRGHLARVYATDGCFPHCRLQGAIKGQYGWRQHDWHEDGQVYPNSISEYDLVERVGEVDWVFTTVVDAEIGRVMQERDEARARCTALELRLVRLRSFLTHFLEADESWTPTMVSDCARRVERDVARWE